MPTSRTDSSPTSQLDGHGSPSLGTTDTASTRPPGPSTRLALVVVAIAGALLLIAIVAGYLTSNTPAPSATPRPLTIPHTSLTPVASRPVLGTIMVAGEPPANILDALVVPRGTTAVPGSAVNNAVGLYDRSLRLSVPASQQAVITFFRAALVALQWHLVSQGPPPGGTSGYRLIAQHPGSDGYEWELGVTVAATRFPNSAPATGVTPATLRLYADDDES